eukprot:269281-Rhodomonas_salina.1
MWREEGREERREERREEARLCPTLARLSASSVARTIALKSCAPLIPPPHLLSVTRDPVAVTRDPVS